MELRHLRYFMAVAEHESVRLASAHLHITQRAFHGKFRIWKTSLGVCYLNAPSAG